MRRSKDSVGHFPLHLNTTQRSPPSACLGTGESPVPVLSRKNLQAIGVYLTRFFGSNVRFRILKELGSFEPVVCVSEVVYPDRFYGTRVGITRGVLK